MARSLAVIIGWQLLAASPALAAAAQDTAGEIRTEAMRSSSDPDGCPLPLASYWNPGRHPAATGWAPDQQLQLIQEGHHLLLCFDHPRDGRGQSGFNEYYEPALKRARELKLPLLFLTTQWECLLSTGRYLDLPPEKNPNVVTPEGKILPKVSPFGPVELWQEVGKSWSDNEAMQQVQQWYPDPPLVIFLSNNEHAKLSWTDAEKSKRYLDKYGKGKSGEFKRKVVTDGWIERYPALQEGMRSGLVNPAWKDHALFVGYEAFGPCCLGRWGGWEDYALNSTGRISPAPLMWDGGSPSYYLHHWCGINDYTVYSPQIESMNWVFMSKEALRLNPRFWFEISTWVGKESGDAPAGTRWKPDVFRSLGQTFNPARYGGFVQFGMWLLRPRAVREYRGTVFPFSEGKPYLMAIVDAVDRVYANPTLRSSGARANWSPIPPKSIPIRRQFPANIKTWTAGSCWTPTSTPRSAFGNRSNSRRKALRRYRCSRWHWCRASRRPVAGWSMLIRR